MTRLAPDRPPAPPPLAPGRIVALSALALLPVLALAVAWMGRTALFLLFAGILFAAILDAATRGLRTLSGLSRPWAVGLVIAATLLTLLAAIGLGGAWLVDQAGALYTALEAQARDLAATVERLRPTDAPADAPGDAPADAPLSPLRELGGLLGGGDGAAPLSFAGATLGALANAALIVVIGIFLALDPDLYKRGLVRLFPTRLRADADDALHAAGETLRRWLVGKLMAMALIAALTGAGLLLLGFPLALPLALLAGLMAFVPNIGPILTYVPIALAGLSVGGGTAAAGLAVYAVAQSVESYVFTPLIQKRMVALPPALILLAQVLGGLLFGLWGIALATPLAAVLKLWVERYYVRGALEGRSPDPGPDPGPDPVDEDEAPRAAA